MKFPHAIADFHRVITEGYFYVDRTAHLAEVEEIKKQLFFLRPRRFGKSLWLSTLENYHDLAEADQFGRLFGRLFGHLAVGRNPTPKRNQYFVLKWDFSTISTHGTADDIVQVMHNQINVQIERFALLCKAWLSHEIKIDPKEAIYSFQSLPGVISLTPHRLYLLIDEYYNFANELLMSGQSASRERYEALLRGEGALKTVFKTVKGGAAGMGVDRVFITGVAPVMNTRFVQRRQRGEDRFHGAAVAGLVRFQRNGSRGARFRAAGLGRDQAGIAVSGLPPLDTVIRHSSP